MKRFIKGLFEFSPFILPSCLIAIVIILVYPAHVNHGEPGDTTKTDDTALGFYDLGHQDGVQWAVECASKEIIYGHPADIECVDFYLARQKLVADHEDWENLTK